MLKGRAVVDGLFADLACEPGIVHEVAMAAPALTLHRPERLPWPQSWGESRTIGSLPAQFAIVKDCYVFPTGAVMVGDKYFYREILFLNRKKRDVILHLSTDTALCPDDDSIRIAVDLPVTELEGPVFVNANFRHRNFYHFVHDVLAKSICLEAAEAIIGKKIPVLMHKNKFPIQNILNDIVFPNRTARHDGARIYHIDTAIVARKTADGVAICTPAMLHLRQKLQAALPPSDHPQRLLYISRQDGKNLSMSRDLDNEAQLRERLEELGFETLIASQMAPEDQLRAFTNARVLAGIHGAGLTNMIFMPEGGAVMEISGVPQGPDSYARDCAMFDFDYMTVDSEMGLNGPCANLAALEANIAHLSARGLL